MTSTIQKTALAAAITTTLIASGGGGGGLAGIGGSGFISTGTVTGFGSIFVNGVEFETDSASFDIDDSASTGISGQNKLAIGMRVKVNGTVNSDGVTGTATSVKFEDQLEGPISAACTEDADGENKTCTILGVPVKISSADTVFVGTINYDTLAKDDNIQVSGFYDANGALNATAIVEKNIFSPSTTTVEIKGTITTLEASTQTLTLATSPSLTIDTSAIDTSNFTAGQFVEIKGTLVSVNATTLNATLIKLDDNDLADGTKTEIESIVTRFASATDFDIDGITVNAGNAVFVPDNLANNLRTGVKIEVEGTVENDILQATAVKLRGGNIKVHATVTSSDNNGFTVTINGTPITVTTDTATRIEDPVSINDFVRVRGYENNNGGITATRVDVRSSTDKVIVQGNLQEFTQDTSIKVLGVTFDIDVPAETEFQNEQDNGISQSEFAAAVTNNPNLLIKVRDDDPVNGIADEIDIETP